MVSEEEVVYYLASMLKSMSDEEKKVCCKMIGIDYDTFKKVLDGMNVKETEKQKVRKINHK